VRLNVGEVFMKWNLMWRLARTGSNQAHNLPGTPNESLGDLRTFEYLKKDSNWGKNGAVRKENRGRKGGLNSSEAPRDLLCFVPKETWMGIIDNPGQDWPRDDFSRSGAQNKLKVEGNHGSTHMHFISTGKTVSDLFWRIYGDVVFPR
jgi:hypothetical protein